jgi:hypothetical protein
LVFDLPAPLGVSVVVAVEIVPVLVPAPLAGTLVDQPPRIPVMAAADLLRAGLAAVYNLGGALLVLAAAIGRHGIR